MLEPHRTLNGLLRCNISAGHPAWQEISLLFIRMSCGSADEQERNLNIVGASDPRRKRDEFQRFRAGLFLTPLTVVFRGIVVESKNTRFEWRACGSLDPLFSPRLEPAIGLVLLAIFCRQSRILGESLKRSSEKRNAGEAGVFFAACYLDRVYARTKFVIVDSFRSEACDRKDRPDRQSNLRRASARGTL